ncbi:2-amino-4-hydroxy-6-hydroxymethyldihydropteridine diphosphokinase [Rhizobium alvei]|uniref:2-amino-4-hydroxy-6- hydroxymethyldihydropteridine diphosphokinase n=1 Tax=Rhizobium alvei TaxID=1132659 RepID=UPI00348ADA00
MSEQEPAVTAYLGLGGNVGDPVASMAEALRALDARADCSVEAVSRLYRTPPWGKTDQAWFFNSAAAIRTTLAPQDLLDLCLSIERQMKRERLERWGPRTLDIDILAYGSLEINVDRLHVPHPRMQDRAFVLMPLMDVAPGFVFGGRSVESWLEDADRAGIEVADSRSDWWR